MYGIAAQNFAIYGVSTKNYAVWCFSSIFFSSQNYAIVIHLRIMLWCVSSELCYEGLDGV